MSHPNYDDAPSFFLSNSRFENLKKVSFLKWNVHDIGEDTPSYFSAEPIVPYYTIPIAIAITVAIG